MASIASPSGRRQALTAFFLAVTMAAVVGMALAFEHIGGYIPCKLCLEQRYPYYAGVPLMVLAGIVSMFNAPGWVTRGLLLAGGLLMAVGLVMSVRHAGIEWSWWAGPSDCGSVATSIDTGGEGILGALDSFTPPSCDKAALRVLGLSFAGWNVIASLALGLIAFRGAFAQK